MAEMEHPPSTSPGDASHAPPPATGTFDEHAPEQHEQSDISIKSLVIFFVVFLVFAVVTHVGVFVVYAGFDRAEQGRKQDVSGVEATLPPPPVRLQGIPGVSTRTPAEDMALFDQQQRMHLNSGGPTTQPGVVRIPITDAMRLVIERDLLPTRPPATQPAGEGGAR